MKVFLGFRFGPNDKELVECCDRIIASHHPPTLVGDTLGGEVLTEEVKKIIDGADAVVGLLTRRDAIVGGNKFTTHRWVIDELNYARDHKKRAIALVEGDVEVGGMYQENEIIALDRNNPLPAMLRLAETLGKWQRGLGEKVKVKIMPGALAKKLGGSNSTLECFHRIWSGNTEGPWTKGKVIPNGGGTFVVIDGVQKDDLIQIKAEGGARREFWESEAVSQWLSIELENGGGK